MSSEKENCPNDTQVFVNSSEKEIEAESDITSSKGGAADRRKVSSIVEGRTRVAKEDIPGNLSGHLETSEKNYLAESDNQDCSQHENSKIVNESVTDTAGLLNKYGVDATTVEPVASLENEDSVSENFREAGLLSTKLCEDLIQKTGDYTTLEGKDIADQEPKEGNNRFNDVLSQAEEDKASRVDNSKSVGVLQDNRSETLEDCVHASRARGIVVTSSSSHIDGIDDLKKGLNGVDKQNMIAESSAPTQSHRKREETDRVSIFTNIREIFESAVTRSKVDNDDLGEEKEFGSSDFFIANLPIFSQKKRVLRQKSITEMYASAVFRRRKRKSKGPSTKQLPLELVIGRDSIVKDSLIAEGGKENKVLLKEKKRSYPFANSQNLHVQQSTKRIKKIAIPSKRRRSQDQSTVKGELLRSKVAQLRDGDHEELLASDDDFPSEASGEAVCVIGHGNAMGSDEKGVVLDDGLNSSVSVYGDIDKKGRIFREMSEICGPNGKNRKFLLSACQYFETKNDFYLFDIVSKLKIFRTLYSTPKGFTFYANDHWEADVSDASLVAILAEKVEKKCLKLIPRNASKQSKTIIYEWLQLANTFYIEGLFSSVLYKLKSTKKDKGNKLQMRMSDEFWDYLPFENGVYSFKEHQLKPHSSAFYNKFIVLHKLRVGFKYAPFDKFIKEIFIDESEREYSLYIISTLFTEIEPNDHLTFFLGNGANGKTLLIWLILKCLGRYGSAANSSLFARLSGTEERASPALLSYRDQRAAFIVEPENTKLRSELIKKLCGGGELLKGRNLYSSEMVSFEMRTKLVICCNEMPKFDECEYTHSIQRRLRTVYFKTSFVNDAKLAHQRKINRGLKQTMKRDAQDWMDAFYNMIFEIARKYSNCAPPPIPKTYMVEDDIVFSADKYDELLAEFLTLKTYYIEKRAITTILKSKKLYESYIAYLNENYDPAKEHQKAYPYRHFYNVSQTLILAKYNIGLTVQSTKTKVEGSSNKKSKIRGYKNLFLK